jgi:hypothetical protein
MAYTMNQVKDVAKRLKYNGDIKSLEYGMNAENKEHKDVIKGSATTAGRIAVAHLKESPKYYEYLEKMEARFKR